MFTNTVNESSTGINIKWFFTGYHIEKFSVGLPSFADMIIIIYQLCV